ncbi:MAG TPA: hypothetical protein VMD77_00450 [Candidatus Baltobacteraceae bacterium]|jgi:hypothetical protein|nr:hypothetical protein [Candidatus Baltobacteraceae bacterium]
MGCRNKAWLRATWLTLLPVTLVFPVISVAHFEPTGPARVWPLVAFALVAMWAETRALAVLLGMYQRGRDPYLIAILPLALLSLVTYAFSGGLLLLAMPTIIHHLA